MVDKHVKGVEFLLKKNGVTVIRGHGTLTGATSVRVSGGESGDVDASGTDLILATGRRPLAARPGRRRPSIITSDEALQRADVPGSVTIVGAGAVGVEWASMYRDFGAEVHLVEFLDRLVPLEDADVSKELGRVFRKRDITAHLSSTIDTESIKPTDEGLRFTVARARVTSAPRWRQT